MAEAEVDPLVGQVLSGRFEIVAPVGVGGMGRVYRAVQRPLDRVVALKVLNPRYDGLKDPGFERRFFLEASMTARLKHPNTITVHDYGRTDDGVYFIAMEYLEGETLQQVLGHSGPLPWARALFIGGQIARSLREAHKLGLVHRDLKPANVMLLSEGTGGEVVKVLDFGLVKSITPDRPQAREADRTGLTQAGVLLGSPLYMAPEQARGEADPRTDIYALGVLLYQAIAGRTPFVGTESIDLIVKHLRERPDELRALVPGLPDAVNALVMRCLEKDPAARFQSMDAVLDAMRAASAGAGLSGAFADPRTATGTVPRALTPALPSTAVPLAPPAPAEAGEARPRLRTGWLVPTVVAAVVALGAVVGVVTARVIDAPPVTPPPLPPPPVAVPEAPKAAVEPTPRPRPPPEVRFELDSTPQGAAVLRDGLQLGVTPFAVTLPREGEAPLTVELQFVLEGYAVATVVAQGLEGTVPVTQALTRLPEPPRPTVRPERPPPEGYKTDPYQ